MEFRNFTSDWADGRVICAVAAALVPGFQFAGRRFESTQAIVNIRAALNALQTIGVPMLIDVWILSYLVARAYMH